MVVTHLIETSVLTRIVVPEVAGALRRYADEFALGRCTISDLEVCFSASNAREWDSFESVLADFAPIEVTPSVLNRAKAVQRSLAERHLKGRKIPDLIIAAAAELAGLTILHYDQDFELIASVTGQPHQWVVPKGSID